MSHTTPHDKPHIYPTVRERIRKQTADWKLSTSQLRDLAAIAVYRHQLSSTVAMDLLAALKILDGLADAYRKDEIGE